MELVGGRYTLYYGDQDIADPLDLSAKFFTELVQAPPTLEEAFADLGIKLNKSSLSDVPELNVLEENSDMIKKFELTRDEAYAIGCFLLQFGIGGRPLWEIIDEGLEGSRDRRGLFTIRKMLYLLLSGFRKLPRARVLRGQKLYRAIQSRVLLAPDGSGRQHYAKGEKVTWWGFTWVSAGSDTARRLVGDSPENTVFVFKEALPWGCNVQMFSDYEELGVVVEPELELKVTDIAQTGTSLCVSVEANRVKELPFERIIRTVNEHRLNPETAYAPAPVLANRGAIVEMSAADVSATIVPLDKEDMPLMLPSGCGWKKCPKTVRRESRYVLDKKNPQIATLDSGFFWDAEWCTVIGDKAIPANFVAGWNIKITKSKNNGEDIYVGVAPSDIDQNQAENYYKSGWYLCCYDVTARTGILHKNTGKEYGPKREKGKGIGTGDTVGVIMDTRKGELSFVIDGVNLGVALNGIPLDKPLVPCVIMKFKGDSVELDTSDVREKVSETIPAPKRFHLKSSWWDSFTVSWTPVKGASLYQIEVDRSKLLDFSPKSIFTKRGLLPETEHIIRVRAVCKDGVGDWSKHMKTWTRRVPQFSECVWKECPEDIKNKNQYYLDLDNLRIACRIGTGNFSPTILGSAPLPLGQVTSWGIKVKSNGNGVLVGVAPSDIDQNSDDVHEKCGWYFHCYNARLCSGPPCYYRWKEYGPKKESGEYVHKGDNVGVVMDTVKGELSFVLNGVNLGVAYEGIPLDKPLVPCVLLRYIFETVQLII